MNRALASLAALSLVFGLLAAAPAPVGAVTTDTFRDEFNNESYSGSDGTASWASAWWESEATQDPTKDEIRVTSDGAEDFTLRFDNTTDAAYVERAADVSAYDTAQLSFDYRRNNLPATVVFKILASADGSSFTEIFSIASGDDAAYLASGTLDITAYKSATTTIRISQEGDISGGKFYLDNVEISAFATNTAPVAVDDVDSTLEDSPVTVDVLGNDSDPELDALSVDSVTQGSNGSVTNSGTDVTYSPDPDWNGVDTFTYTATDGNGGFASAQVTVTVTAQPDPPVAVDDVDSTLEDSPVTVDVLGNDSDPELDALSVDSVTQGSNGSVTNSGTDVTYSPDPDWNGVDTFTYTVSDGNGGFDTANVTVTVTAANDNPQGVADAHSTPEDTAATIDVLANDTDVDSALLTVSAVVDGEHGSVTTDGSTVTYTPDPDWNGVDTFTYRVSDDSGGWCETTVTVTVTPVNDGPVAVDDNATTMRDNAVYVWVLDNDTDPDADPLTVAAVTNGAHGTVTNNSIKVTYTPAQGWNGADTFTYTVTDGSGGFASAVVTVTVTEGPNRPPVGQDDSKVTNEDVAVTIPVLANDSDPDGDALCVGAVNQGAHGEVTKTATTVTYTPDEDWSGMDAFSYTVTDGVGGSAVAAVVVKVVAVSDPPDARNDVKSTVQGVAVTIPVLANDSDADGDPLSVTGFTQGGHGTVTGDAVTVIYQPSPGWTGVDTFTYTITDGDGGYDFATVTITVGLPNLPPEITLTGDPTVAEEDPLLLRVETSDADGDSVSITATGLPDWASIVDHGDGTATIVGTPGFDDAAPAIAVTVVVTDGSTTAEMTFDLEVIDTNRPPLIDRISFSGVGLNGSFSFTIRASDPDGDPVVVTAMGLPSWAGFSEQPGSGAVITSDGVPANATGSFLVTVTVSDGDIETTSVIDVPLVELQVGAGPLPIEQTHGFFEDEGELVITGLQAPVATPDTPRRTLTPREGLMVAFESAVETLKNQVIPFVVLGVVMAWMLMIGVGRRRDEDEQAEPA